MNELDGLADLGALIFSLSPFDSIHSMPLRFHSLARDESLDCLECDGNNRSVELKHGFVNQLELRAFCIREMK
jgi:hypothetical protein